MSYTTAIIWRITKKKLVKQELNRYHMENKIQVTTFT